MLVALTGCAAESDKSSALAAGFDYHLTKPLSLKSPNTFFPTGQGAILEISLTVMDTRGCYCLQKWLRCSSTAIAR